MDQIGLDLSDYDGNSVTPTDTETVSVTDALPTITVSKDNVAAGGRQRGVAVVLGDRDGRAARR